MYLKRKIDEYLLEWKKNEERLPLIIKGARQIGKTESINHFTERQLYRLWNLREDLHSRCDKNKRQLCSDRGIHMSELWYVRSEMPKTRYP